MQFNEQHVDALCHALDGDPKQIALLNVHRGYDEASPPMFAKLLQKLTLMFIKKSAAVPGMKLFKSMSYDSPKGIKYFYTQLLQAAECMITRPDQATFNEHFINALPSHIRDELVMCDQILVDYSTCEELWTTVLRVDHAMDSLRAVQAYKTLGKSLICNWPLGW